MKRTVIGHYFLGHDQVEIVAREGADGGEFYRSPEAGKCARVGVGMDGSWDWVVSTVLHELTELEMDKLQCRFRQTDNLGADHAHYLFIMTHQQFTDVCVKVGECLTKALPDILREYKKRNKKKKES